MKPNPYVRTNEIKQKQSRTMKQKIALGEIDYVKRNLNHKNTIKKKQSLGEKIGRKSSADGGVYLKKGINKPCPVCMVDVYYIQKEILQNKRKCCSRTCLMKDEVYIQKLKKVDKSYLQTKEYRQSITSAKLPAFKKYQREVRRLSKINYALYYNQINPNNYPRTLCGVKGGYQLDHIKSIKECWNDKITEEEASSCNNLKIIPWEENLKKRKFDIILEHGN